MPSRPAVTRLALVALALLASAPPGSRGPANRLADEPSPYLQLHAHNPVDWYPWGDEAFAKARAEDKPIFLSVGYSTCYWCHVMEREVFSNAEIAKQLNAQFVSIKVDREERPDIDHVYMRATQLMTGSGGWPNSVFMTPEGQPFYAGTYFPPEDRRGQPGFPRVLDALHQTWTQDRAKVIETAARVTRQIEALDARGAAESRPLPELGALFESALASLAADFDAEHGGFGNRQKFPRAPSLALLLARLETGQDARAREMLEKTLDAMALGGLYDQLGDGFHRYSTEASWSLPHFEKMLYDNALLVSVYARAFEATQRPLYRRVVERSLAYLEREMSRPGGGFASAQDAEVDGVEGASYVWTREGIEAVLGAKRTAGFLAVHELVPLPEHGEGGVLRVKLPLAARLKESGAPDAAALLARFDADRAKLLAARDRRTQPLRDDKVLAAWNGLVIRALVDAGRALEHAPYLQRAQRAADFVVKELLLGDELRRSHIAGQSRERGVLEDYAYLADALLALHGATDEKRWLEGSRTLADAMLERFEDGALGGFFLTPQGTELLVRPKAFEDDALPSGNGVALRVLRKLASQTGERRYAEAAERSAAAAAGLLDRAPRSLATVVGALATTPAPVLARAEPKPDGPDALAMPRSQDHVGVRALRGADATSFRVVVSIDEGWHVNANPASNRFLIPTGVELPDDAAARITYPEGHAFAPAFADEPIQVYEGSVEIAVELESQAALPEQVQVRYQACDETRCLAPHRESVALESEEVR